MMNSMCAVSFWVGCDESSPTFGMAYHGDMSYVDSTKGLGTAKKT